MLTRYQYLLTKLTEEASEVAQIALKTQQFGANEVYPEQSLTNTQRIHAELIDLLAIVEMLNEEFSFNFATDSEETWYCKLAKKEKVNKYYRYSQDCGMVEDPFNYDGE
jgi:NTP pyrophosphatase (non-canonical NTP hydrolase)